MNWTFLRQDDINLTLQIIKKLKNIPWSNIMFRTINPQNLLDSISKGSLTNEQILQLRANFFEFRIAYVIHRAGFLAEYEYKVGIGNSSVDFGVYIEPDNHSPKILIELTSLRDSDNVKRNTIISGNMSKYESTTTPWDRENSPEIIELKKIQNVILNKVTNNEKNNIKPIKFPQISYSNKNSHIIIIDVRGSNGGSGLDINDYRNLLYGGKSFTDPEEHDLYAVYEIKVNEKKEIRRELIKGIFDSENSDPRSKYLQDRIHGIGFIHEKRYELDEIKSSNIRIFPNPKFTKKLQSLNYYLEGL